MSGQHRLRLVLVSVALAAAFCFAAGVPLYAQTTSASVSGTVKDAQGGVLPGVSIVLLNEARGTEQTAVSDEKGDFLFPYVQPGTYTVKLTLTGFQTFEKTGIIVNANDRLSVGSMTLTLGQLSESVVVTGVSTDIQLKSGERAYTLQSQAIQNLAVNGRSFFGLAIMVPGVLPNTDTPGQVSNFNVNGQRSNSNNMTIDGVANIDTGDNGGNMAQTNLDAISEFKVLTSSYQAEYGRAVGGQVQVVTKSGSNRFAGSAYWYARRSGWNANTWWNNRSGTAMQVSSRNDSGFTFGGPVLKQKLFFFYSQEFQRRKDPVGETRVTVPTALERRGDFSQSVDANGNPYPYIRDFQLAQANPTWGCSATDTRACFADGGVLGRIPASRFYAPTMAALSIFPDANTTGRVGYNYASQTPSKNPLNQSLIRMDYQFNSNWRLTGRYMMHQNTATLPYGIGGWSVRSNLDNIDVTSTTPGQNFLVSSTGIINNTTSLELSFGRAHNSLDHITNYDKMKRSATAIAGIPMFFPDAIQLDYIPQFNFGGGRIANSPFYNTNQAPFTNFNTTYDIVANLTKVMGSHAAKAGFYYQKSLKDQSNFANFNGSMSFNNNTSNPYDSQHPFANAVLGIYDSFNQASAFRKGQWRYTNYEWYLQDNWKTTNKLTLDYGVRFYYLTPQYDKSLQASNFLPEKFDPSKAVRLYTPAVINGTRVGYDPVTGGSVIATYIGRIVPNSGDRFQGSYQAGQGISDTLTDGNKFRVSPRVGAAYDITGAGKYVARGAFGIFYDRPQGNQVFDLTNNPPSTQTPNVQWGLVSGLAAATPLYAPVGINPNVYAWKTPTVYQWNLGFQMQLPANFTLDLSYVGSKSDNLLQFRNLNAIPYGVAYQDKYKDPTRGQTCSGCSGLSTLPGGNALPQDLLAPYQGYTGIRLWEFEAYSDYKSIQTTVSRRFTKGLMFSGYYAYSQARGTLGGDWDYARIDGKDREANYGPLSFDRPHSFVVNFVYQTPAVTQNGLKWVTNDWQISGNYRWYSGTPASAGFSIPGIGNVNLTGSYTEGARIALTGQDPGKGYNNSDPYKQFNIAAFTSPQPGSIGLESPRYTMINPPTNNLDLSLSKSFPFGGPRRLEIRLDAFNALNHTQFSGVNRTLNFASLTDPTVTNMPYNAAGQLVNQNGVGTVNGVRAARQLQLMARFQF